MSGLKLGQRRIMPDGCYVTVVAIGPEHMHLGGQYKVTVFDTTSQLEFTRAYGTVSNWPHTPCTNEAHASIQDCIRAGAGCPGTLGPCTMVYGH